MASELTHRIHLNHPMVRVAAALLAACVVTAARGASGPTVERRVHRFLEVAVSPDGTRVATVEGDSPVGGYFPDIRDLVIRTAAEGKAAPVPLPCGRVAECWPASLAWTPDSRHLAFTIRTPGSHSYAVYVTDADGGSPTKVFSFSGTLERLSYAPDGTLAMLGVENAVKEVGATEARAPVAGDLDVPPAEQRIAVLEGGSLRWASPANLFVYEYDWRPDGRGFVATAAPGDGDDNWWVAKLYAFERAGGAARVLYAPSSIREQLAEPRVSPDGRQVAFIAGIMSDFGSTGGDAYLLRLDSGAVRNLTSNLKASVTGLAWTCGGELGAWLLAGKDTEWVTLDRGSKPGSPTVRWNGAELVGAGERIACPTGVMAASHESFTSPPELAVGRPGTWRDITRANAGLETPATVRSVQWKSDGFDVQGWLLLPQRVDDRVPLVTIVHGGPAAAAQARFAGPGLQWRMLERGWAVFYPNPRGSFGQGETFTLANVRDFGHGDLRDILAGIDAVEREAPIDNARLGLFGGSYGGFMAMWTVTQTQRFRAVVAAAGISNWVSYYGENGIDEWMLPYFGASAYEDPAVYARSSAINYIRNVHTPTFVWVGERDLECPPAQTQEFWHALKTLGVPTAIMIYPGEGHGLRDPAHAADALERTLAWFDRYLRP